MRYFLLIILIVLSLGFFFMYVKPRWDSTKAMRTEIASYNASLDTADKLKTSREELIAKYNSIPKEDLDNLKMLLPDSVDNIRLIIQIDMLATRNGLSTVRNVDYQVEQKPLPGQIQSPDAVRKPYGEFDIAFTTTGLYKNFLSFLSDLEENLRVVDVTEVEFVPTLGVQNLAGNMSYKVKLRTYWLKQ